MRNTRHSLRHPTYVPGATPRPAANPAEATEPADPVRRSTTEAKTKLVEFENAPFPFDSAIDPRRRKHGLARARALQRSARAAAHPKGFDARRPGLIVVFLHGHRATIERDVRDRQRVADQIALANVNAVLVAPQFAVNASTTPAPGGSGSPTALRASCGEAGAHLARLHGDWRTRKTFATLPVVVVAYSGGYRPRGLGPAQGRHQHSVIGVLMLDALYGEAHKYADWIERHPNAFFVSGLPRLDARAEPAAAEDARRPRRPLPHGARRPHPPRQHHLHPRQERRAPQRLRHRAPGPQNPLGRLCSTGCRNTGAERDADAVHRFAAPHFHLCSTTAVPAACRPTNRAQPAPIPDISTSTTVLVRAV